MAALTAAADFSAGLRPGVHHVEVAAAAGRTFQAKLFFVLLHASPLRCFCRSESLTRVRRGAALPPVPASAAPCIEAAAAQPTRQSSQWLSGRDALSSRLPVAGLMHRKTYGGGAGAFFMRVFT